MKFNKAIICLVVCLLVLNVAQARQGKSLAKKSQSQTQSLLASQWNEVDVKVKGTAGVYQFNCKLKDAALNQKALGLAFDAYEQISGQDQTGFWKYINKLYKIDGQDMEKPVLDYRFVDQCAVKISLSGGFFSFLTGKTATLEFQLKANEEYNNLDSSKQNKGSSWTMQMTFGNAGEDKAASYKAEIEKNCQTRNKVMNDLKQNAITTGKNYNSLYTAFQNREQTLEQMALQTDNAEKVVQDVKDEQQKEKAQLDSEVEANQKLLDDTNAQIQKIAANKQTIEGDTTALSLELDDLKIKLNNLRNANIASKQAAEKAAKKLNEARNLQVQIAMKKANLKKETEQKAAETAAEQAALKEASDARQAAFQKELDAIAAAAKQTQEKAAAEKVAADAEAKLKQDKANDELAALNAKVSGASAELTAQQKEVSQLTADLDALNAKIRSMESQIKNLDNLREDLKNQVDAKRTIAQQVGDALKRKQAEKKATKADLDKIKADGEKELQQLKDRLQAQLDLVKGLEEAEKKKQQHFLHNAQNEINAEAAKFKDLLQAIVDQSQVTEVEIVKASQAGLHGDYEKHINAVVSNNAAAMRMTLLRLAKYNRQMQRLSRARQAQVSRVRKSQKQLKNKLRNHKNLSA